MMRLSQLFLHGLLLAAAGCGGGGSGGSAAGAAVPAGGGGGAVGGGGSGGSAALVLSGTLAPGGVEFGAVNSPVGVSLDVQGSGSGLPSVLFGPIQGFGSIVVGGVRVETGSARFTIEGNTGSQSDLRQGQQVLLLADANVANAADVHYRANVKGPLTALTVASAELGTATLTVLGQSVQVDATTVYSDTRLAALAAGQLLEVSGTLDAAGTIRASFVERKSALPEYKVMGRVAGATATTFQLGGLTVDYSAATLANLTRNPANGDIVEVKAAAAAFTAPAQLRASRVERLPVLRVGTAVQARIEGFIDTLRSGADFSVQGVRITTNTATTFVNGTAASLALGVKVQVVGATQADGSVLAQTLTIQPTNAIRAEGPVAAVDVTARTVTVLGVRFALRTLTELEDGSRLRVQPMTLADLGIGDYLEVRGYLDGSTVVAVSVKRDDADSRARLRGLVTAENAPVGSVDILSVPVTGQAGITQYRDRNDATMTQAQFHEAVGVGSFVRARWDNFVSTGQVADELEIED